MACYKGQMMRLYQVCCYVSDIENSCAPSVKADIDISIAELYWFSFTRMLSIVYLWSRQSF